MRRLIWVLAVVVSLFASLAFSASAVLPNTWTALGPSAAQVLALAASPDASGVLYGATENRVWKSTNWGAAWTATGSGPTALAQSMVSDPGDGDRVVAGTTGCKVWVSANGGANWSQPLNPFPGAGSCTPVLAWSPSGLFALARGTFYYSDDGGLSWSVRGVPPGAADARALVVLATAPATVYIGTESGKVKLSTDGGATWSDRSSGLPTIAPPPVSRLAVDPADDEILYAELEGAGLYRTESGGLSWHEIEPPSIGAAPLSFPVTLATTPTTLIAVAGTDAYR
jgi:photosystem II stability/assembly factor-like uncharacterized protein